MLSASAALQQSESCTLPHERTQNIPILFAEFKSKANRYAASDATLFNFCAGTWSTYTCRVSMASKKGANARDIFLHVLV